LPTATLSCLVRHKLSTLGRRVVWSQRLRRVTTVIIALVLLHFGIFALSLWPGLNTLALRAALAAFAMAAMALVAWHAYWLWRFHPRDKTLAALLERRFPELGEKLLSTVAPGDAATPFVALLSQATDRQLETLDARSAYSLRPTARRAILAACFLLAPLVLLAAAPRYARFSARFFLAWAGPQAGYRLEVSPGDAWAARGRSATVTARLFLDDWDAPLPADCFVVYHEDGVKPRRVRMDRAEAGAFLFSWPSLHADVNYHVEAGELVSGPFRLGVVDAVELAQPPEIRVTPPPYVNREHVPVRTLTDGGPFSAVQFSSLRFTLGFTGPAVGVTLKLHDASSGEALADLHVPTENEGLGATVELFADRCGNVTATLVVEGEHGITTTQALPSWTVRADAPPHFTKPVHVRGVRNVTLSGKHCLVAVDDPLRVQAHIEDDEGLRYVALEYRINEGPVVALPWLNAGGRLRVEIDRLLPMPRGLKEGDRLHFRLRAADNRAFSWAPEGAAVGVPRIVLTPQIVYSPAGSPGQDRWIELKIGKNTDSLLRQEIADQRADMERAIEQVRQKLRKEHALLGPLRQASHQRADLSPAQVRQLAEAGKLNKQAVRDLDQLAAKLADVAELAPLGDHLLAIGETELNQAEQAMARFQGRNRTTAEREKDVQAGEAAVLQAIKKLDGLAALGERLALGRLDRLEMERLANAEEELARRAQDLLAGDDAGAPAAAQELAEVRAEQDRLAARLKELAEKSELLQDALAQAEQTQAKQLADDAGKLAQQEKSLMGSGKAGNGPDAEKHQAEAMKMLDEANKLADDALRLAQQASKPETKKMAQEAAHAAADAGKAMKKGLDAKAKGDPSEAKAMAAETLLKLEMARKNLDGLADKMPSKTGDPKTEGPKTGDALADGQKQVKMAQQKLQARPGQAPKAMRQAAKALDKTARQMGRQMAQSVPKLAGRPSLGAAGGAGGGLPLSAALAKKLEPFQGRAWGELPGELKTQLLQDARTYFGEDYAPIIQQYFEQITERRR
jgi:hypothetical protein